MAKLFEVIVQGTLAGQQTIWKSNWMSQGVGADDAIALDVLVAMGYDGGAPAAPEVASVLAGFQGCNRLDSQITSLFARNVYNDEDIMDVPLSTAWAGLRGGATYMPPFVAPKVRSGRTRLDVRRGFVSLWGISEDQVVNDDVLVPAYIAFMQSFCNYLAGGISGGAGLGSITYLNVIAGKERYMVPGSGTDPETNPARWAYRYYADEAEQLTKLMIDPPWAPVNVVSSQISRKRGKGA